MIGSRRRIVRVDEHGQVLGVRRSPKRETVVAVFDKRTPGDVLAALPAPPRETCR